MNIKRLLLSSAVMMTLTATVVPAEPAQAQAQPTKMTRAAFYKLTTDIHKDYLKLIPATRQGGTYVNEKTQVVYIGIVNLKQNQKYVDLFKKKYGKNVGFYNAEYSVQGLKKARLKLENYVKEQQIDFFFIGTDTKESKVIIGLDDSHKSDIALLKKHFPQAAYEIQAIPFENRPQLD